MKIKQWFTRFKSWRSAQRLGLLAGLVAALVMTLILLLLRSIVGLPTPTELIGDRTAPLLPLPIFFVLLGVAGGDNLKGFEVIATVLGQLVVGALGGAIYQRLAAQQPNLGSRNGRLARSARLGLYLGGLVAFAWAASLVVFWPLFSTGESHGANHAGGVSDERRTATAAPRLPSAGNRAGSVW